MTGQSTVRRNSAGPGHTNGCLAFLLSTLPVQGLTSPDMGGMRPIGSRLAAAAAARTPDMATGKVSGLG